VQWNSHRNGLCILHQHAWICSRFNFSIPILKPLWDCAGQYRFCLSKSLWVLERKSEWDQLTGVWICMQGWAMMCWSTFCATHVQHMLCSYCPVLQKRICHMAGFGTCQARPRRCIWRVQLKNLLSEHTCLSLHYMDRSTTSSQIKDELWVTFVACLWRTHMVWCRQVAEHLRAVRVLAYFQQCFGEDPSPFPYRESKLFARTAMSLVCHAPYQVPIWAVDIRHLHGQVSIWHCGVVFLEKTFLA
jgi:hypothetical protein